MTLIFSSPVNAITGLRGGWIERGETRLISKYFTFRMRDCRRVWGRAGLARAESVLQIAAIALRASPACPRAAAGQQMGAQASLATAPAPGARAVRAGRGDGSLAAI